MQKRSKIGSLCNKQSLIELRIPQMGEGLREVEIIRLLKQVGDEIKKDEVIYEMETEKSVVEIESPHNGYIKAWFVKEGDVLEVGSILATIQIINSDDYQNHKKLLNEKSAKKKQRNNLNPTIHILNNISQEDIRSIPPRVRTYCRKYNLKDKVIMTIPYSGKILTTEDVDKFLATYILD